MHTSSRVGCKSCLPAQEVARAHAPHFFTQSSYSLLPRVINAPWKIWGAYCSFLTEWHLPGSLLHKTSNFLQSVLQPHFTFLLPSQKQIFCRQSPRAKIPPDVLYYSPFCALVSLCSCVFRTSPAVLAHQTGQAASSFSVVNLFPFQQPRLPGGRLKRRRITRLRYIRVLRTEQLLQRSFLHRPGGVGPFRSCSGVVLMAALL